MRWLAAFAKSGYHYIIFLAMMEDIGTGRCFSLAPEEIAAPPSAIRTPSVGMAALGHPHTKRKKKG
jgi:hypothetical protein